VGDRRVVGEVEHRPGARQELVADRDARRLHGAAGDHRLT